MPQPDQNDFLVNWATEKGFTEIADVIHNKGFNFQRIAQVQMENIHQELGVSDIPTAIKIIQALDELFNNVAEKV